MIHRLLSFVADELNDYLGGYYEEPSGFAKVGEIGGEDAEEDINKIIISLFNIERETAMGIGNVYQAEGSGFMQKSPPWCLNLYFVLAAVYEGKRYAEGLEILSESIVFLQQHGVIFPENGIRYTIELVSLNIQELTNVWSILGGRYYPSVLCKVRMLTMAGNEVKGTASRVRHT